VDANAGAETGANVQQSGEDEETEPRSEGSVTDVGNLGKNTLAQTEVFLSSVRAAMGLAPADPGQVAHDVPANAEKSVNPQGADGNTAGPEAASKISSDESSQTADK